MLTDMAAEIFLEGNIEMYVATKTIKPTVVLSIYLQQKFNYFKIAMSYKQKSSSLTIIKVHKLSNPATVFFVI